MKTPSEWSKEEWSKIIEIIIASEYDYSEEFVFWLQCNQGVWISFLNKTTHASMFKHKERFGAKAIAEILRWESLARDSDITFKINNNFTSDLSRLVMDYRPNLKGYFKIRGSIYRNDSVK